MAGCNTQLWAGSEGSCRTACSSVMGQASLYGLCVSVMAKRVFYGSVCMGLGYETACSPDAGLNGFYSYEAGYKRVTGQHLVGSCGRACDAVMRQHARLSSGVDDRALLREWIGLIVRESK